MSGLSIRGNPAKIAVYRDSGWRTIMGETAVPRREPVPPSGVTRNIASWCNAVNVGKTASSTGGILAETVHRVAVDAINPVLEWVVTTGFGGTTIAGEMRVAVSVGNGLKFNVTFNGQQAVAFAASTSTAVKYTSDPIPLKLLEGDALYIATWLKTPTSGSVPGSFTGARPNLDPGISTGPFNVAVSSERMPGQASNSWALRPARVLAPSDKLSFIGVGDSIMQGYAQPAFIDLALDAKGYAFTKYAQGGDAHPVDGNPRINAYLPYVTHVVDQFGINSPTVGAGLSAWKVWAEGGAKVIKTTLFPAHGTTDNWATLGGQVDNGNHETKRTAYNNWLRDGAPISADKTTALATGTTDPTAIRCSVTSWDGTTITTRSQGHPLLGVVDTAGSLEESRTDGRYNATARAALATTNHTDGLHPNEGVHVIAGTRLKNELTLLGL